MSRRACLLGIAISIAFALAIGPASESQASSPAKRGLVIELFTSQGCSSCPAADRLLSRLGELPNVIPLAFHVDYWDHLGWKDPFSSRAWSERQERYAAVLHQGRLYTPQAVIDGRTHIVGSDSSRLERLLELRRRESPAFDLQAGWTGTDPLTLRVETETLRDIGGEVQLTVAIVESGLETPVRRGENARRVLRNDFVVRSLRVVGWVPGRHGHATRRDLELAPAPGWRRDRLRAVAFLQHPDSLQIFQAASLPFP